MATENALMCDILAPSAASASERVPFWVRHREALSHEALTVQNSLFPINFRSGCRDSRNYGNIVTTELTSKSVQSAEGLLRKRRSGSVPTERELSLSMTPTGFQNLERL